ncbi:unnamed protein product [Vitrella brassicaformis CCMP3155]|uniref:J domain-containing protein n=1 Tax=Vitrella brassicaformis (strain CCMP3155) TaxID=1169540 RepID=A0A0G4F9X2_VITBC|nr:unnamed protein product [Vitrella brassicaformis CCMP3155]|eukprot:CEM09721.1 unnamed protein product [Vitrella brassicaformis CCMP3155]
MTTVTTTKRRSTVSHHRREEEHWFEVLGVDRWASLSAIAKAYQQKALHVHPDKPGGSTEDFKALSNAYENAVRLRQEEVQEEVNGDDNDDDNDNDDDDDDPHAVYVERRMLARFRLSGDEELTYLLEGRVDANTPSRASGGPRRDKRL